jgi:hypothetical protein
VRKHNSTITDTVTVRMTISRSLVVVHAASMEEINSFSILVGKLKEWDHMRDLGIDGRIILKLILEK